MSFLTLNDTNSLFKVDRPTLFELGTSTYLNYFNNLHDSQQVKLDFFKKYKIHMMSLMVKFSSFKVYEDDDEKYLYNFFFNLPYENDYSFVMKQLMNSNAIKKITDLRQQGTPYFEPLLAYLYSVLNEDFHGAYFMFYNKGCRVVTHQHSEGIITYHILLNDITEGELVVTVKEETKAFSKAGEYFLFRPTDPHSAVITGHNCNCLMINVPDPLFNYKST